MVKGWEAVIGDLNLNLLKIKMYTLEKEKRTLKELCLKILFPPPLKTSLGKLNVNSLEIDKVFRF